MLGPVDARIENYLKIVLTFSQDFAQLSYHQIQNQDGYGKIDFVSDILDIPVPDESYDAILAQR